MSVSIRIPAALRRFTEEQGRIEVEAGRVGAALERLCDRYPGLKPQLLDAQGGLRPFVNLYLDGQDIRERRGLDTPLAAGAELRIVPAIAGGSAALPELSPAELGRYSRHLMLPELGLDGQRRLKAARVLIVGAGGLGSPLGLYLAAAGVGTLGLVDGDRVEASNLQRQVLFTVEDIGQSKALRGAERLRALNPYIAVHAHDLVLEADNALALLADYDLVIDGTDNFPTRYLVNDACVLLGKPNLYGSIFRFEGQATLFNHAGGPCYRCLYPEPPPPGLVPSCAEGGVLGILPALIASIQATEAIKLLTGIGTSLSGRLLLYDALAMELQELAIRRDPACPLCGDRPSIDRLVDYRQFCGIPAEAPPPDYAEISVQALHARLRRGEPVTLIDVREPYEREICALPQALAVPLGELEQRLAGFDRDAEILLHCKSGGRSAQACQRLKALGFRHPVNVQGGILAWIREIDPSLPSY